MSSARKQLTTVACFLLIAIISMSAACADGSGPQGGDLAIWGPASAFQVAVPAVVPSTVYQLKVNIVNFSTDQTGGNITDFEISCDIYASDAVGTSKSLLFKLWVRGLAVDAFGATDAVFGSFQWRTDREISGNFFVDCDLDPENMVSEIDEENNEFSFLFRAYCMGSSDPCPGPVQKGSSLPYKPITVTTP